MEFIACDRCHQEKHILYARVGNPARNHWATARQASIRFARSICRCFSHQPVSYGLNRLSEALMGLRKNGQERNSRDQVQARFAPAAPSKPAAAPGKLPSAVNGPVPPASRSVRDYRRPPPAAACSACVSCLAGKPGQPPGWDLPRHQFYIFKRPSGAGPICSRRCAVSYQAVRASSPCSPARLVRLLPAPQSCGPGVHVVREEKVTEGDHLACRIKLDQGQLAGAARSSCAMKTARSTRCGWV